MASTFTTSKKFEKQGTGDNSGTWGVALNAVLDDIDSATHQVGTKSVAGSSNVALTDDEALYRVLKLTGALTGNIEVQPPARAAVYTVWNATTGDFTLTFKPSGATGVVIPQGQSIEVFCDGTNVEEMFPLRWQGLWGGRLSRNGSDSLNDLDVAVGAVSNGTDMYRISAITKRKDATWAVGTNQGAMDSGSNTSASSVYAVWAIMRPDTRVVDILFSASFTAPTMPSNYTKKCLIGAFLTNSSNEVRAFTQIGDEFILLDDPVADVNGAAITGGTFATGTMRAPPLSIVTLAARATYSAAGAGDPVAITVRPVGSGMTHSDAVAVAAADTNADATLIVISARCTCLLDSSRQLEYTATEGGSQTCTVTLTVLSFRMPQLATGGF